MVDCSRLQKEDQHLGDREISLSTPIELDGKSLTRVYVEEKRNRARPEEICFETKSTREKNGWVYRPGNSHFYAFHDVRRKRVLWFPTARLDAFWKRYGDDLIAKHGEKQNKQPTRGSFGDVWRGGFVPVPVQQVKDLMLADGYELEEQVVHPPYHPSKQDRVDNWERRVTPRKEEGGGGDGCLFIAAIVGILLLVIILAYLFGWPLAVGVVIVGMWLLFTR